MSRPDRAWFTTDDYLDLERAGTQKHEFFDGQVFAMSGGTVQHARVARRVLVSFDRRLPAGSPSTEAYDRGEKTEQYQSMPSVTDIVLVAADHPHVTRIWRSGAGWTTDTYDGLAAAVPVAGFEPVVLEEWFGG